MTNGKRPILSLRKDKVADVEHADDDKRIVIGLFDVLLPSRQFIVHHKVASLGQVSLTTEFLLRFLYSLDGTEEDNVAQFFGFDASEMAFVVNEAESRAYVFRRNGQIFLTDAGYSLFKDGDKPQIIEVQKRIEKIGFDLLSMSPCERDHLSDFEYVLPELEILDEQMAATASKIVPDAFRRHYREIVGRKERDVAAGLKKSLYSIDEVVASDRFSAVVPVLVLAQIRKPGEPEPSLDAWKFGHELDDRSTVVNSVASFLDNLKTKRRTEDDHAYQILLELFPEYLKEYKTRNGLSVLRFFKETAVRAGELRIDRATTGIIGPLYTPENSKRIADALEYTVHTEKEVPVPFLWLVPKSATWGASRALGTLLESISSKSSTPMAGKNKPDRADVAIICGKPQKHLQKVFQKILQRPDNGAIPGALEILLIPKRMVAVTVHAPIDVGMGFPVPLGVLSFDPEIVKRTHIYLETQLPQYIAMTDSIQNFDVHAVTQWPDAPEPSQTGNTL